MDNWHMFMMSYIWHDLIIIRYFLMHIITSVTS